jgi:hypothetical protein
MDEEWDFYMDREKKWRWAKMSYHGQDLAQSTKGFNSRLECEEDAAVNGWFDERLVAKIMV